MKGFKKNILIVGSPHVEAKFGTAQEQDILSLLESLFALKGVTVINAGGGTLWELVKEAAKSAPTHTFHNHFPYENSQYIEAAYPAARHGSNKGQIEKIRADHRFFLFEVLRPDFVLFIGGNNDASSPYDIIHEYNAVRSHAIPALASPAFGPGGQRIFNKISGKPEEFFENIYPDEQRSIWEILRTAAPEHELLKNTILNAIVQELQLKNMKVMQ